MVVLGRINNKYHKLKDVTVKTDSSSCMTEQSNILYIWDINKQMKVNIINIQI